MPYFFVRKLSAVAQVGWRCCSYRQHTLALLAAGCKVALPLRSSSSSFFLIFSQLLPGQASPLKSAAVPDPAAATRCYLDHSVCCPSRTCKM